MFYHRKGLGLFYFSIRISSCFTVSFRYQMWSCPAFLDIHIGVCYISQLIPENSRKERLSCPKCSAIYVSPVLPAITQNLITAVLEADIFFLKFVPNWNNTERLQHKINEKQWLSSRVFPEIRSLDGLQVLHIFRVHHSLDLKGDCIYLSVSDKTHTARGTTVERKLSSVLKITLKDGSNL